MTVYELMRSRRSIRRFKPDAPSREVLASLVDAAVTAPSASNQQPWRFLIVRRPETIAGLAGAVRAAVDEAAGNLPPDLAPSFRDYAAWFTTFERAPSVVVALCRPLALLSEMLTEAPAGTLKDLAAEVEHDSAIMSVAMAIQNMLLRATELGLGASVMTGPRLGEPGLLRVLGVQAAWRVAGIVALGYPDEEPQAPARKPLERVLGWIE